MNSLEKILQEIDCHAIEFESFGICNDYISVGWVKEIIQKHLSENKCGECSRRKFYQMGYEEGNKENEWVPCSVRMPNKHERTACDKRGNKYMKRIEIAYMTDTVEYTHGYYDGYKWLNERLHVIKNVIAWKIHVPYKPDPESEDGKRQREREEFFTEYQDSSNQPELNGFLKKRFMEIV